MSCSGNLFFFLLRMSLILHQHQYISVFTGVHRVKVSNVARPLSQQCVSTSCTALALDLQTDVMMTCILDTSTPLPSRKPCWPLGQVWLHYKIPTDMVRLTHISVGVVLTVIVSFEKRRTFCSPILFNHAVSLGV